MFNWKDIFKEENGWDERSISGFFAFIIVCILLIADIMLGWYFIIKLTI